jgi:tripartite-type tricarboxylate transporter receptor subunit TctC
MTTFHLESGVKRIAFALWLPVLASAALAADDYPKSSIAFIIGYGAGGSTDVCNRVLALDVSKQLGQPIVVDNKAGAGSSVSVSYTIHQRPDGYTIASLSTGGLLNQVLTPGIKYDVSKDITPIAMVAQYQAGVVVRADSPYKSIADLIKGSQASKTPLSYSTAGIGTPQHLTAERLAQRVGVTWVHAPYKSGPEAITALLRGDVDFLSQTAEWVGQVREGKLRLLAVLTDERMKGFDAPTLKEAGYDLTAPSLLGVYGPAKMEAGVVKKLQDAFQKAVRTPEFERCSDQLGLKPDFKDAAAFSAYINDTLTSWTPLLKQFAAKE